ncbi:MAG: single-stranded DNA-binding protein [Candidatus Omnitrophica bacterium]|nr:single-stranded DNA-binding protein [Candidatus Omnitrophota bacterium]
MTGINRVFVGGNLTRDPELRYTPQGSSVVNFSIAINRTYTTQTGERKEEVEFVRIVVWGKQAETCSRYLTKGSSVLVEGRLSSRSWEGQDGLKRTVTEVIARRVHFLGGLKKTTEGIDSAPVDKETPLETDLPSESEPQQEFPDEGRIPETDKPPF